MIFLIAPLHAESSFALRCNSDIAFKVNGSSLMKPILPSSSHKYASTENSPRIPFREKVPDTFIKLDGLDSPRSASMLGAFNARVDQSSGDNTMININKRSLVVGGLFLPTIVTGLWLTQKGSPPPVGLTTLHKFSVLANMYYLNKTFFDMKKLGAVTDTDYMTMGVMNLFFVGTIATGAMLTMDHDWPQSVTTAHHVTPWLTMAASGLMMYMLNR